MMAMIALVVILSCGALIDGVQEFRPWTLVPVGATVVLILSAANRHSAPDVDGWMPLPNKLLASPWLVALGAMSYSLYLWHWPLLIFRLALSDLSEAGVIDGGCVVLLSGLLAYATTRFVENPLRHRARVGVTAGDSTPIRLRLRRPTLVVTSVVTLLQRPPKRTEDDDAPAGLSAARGIQSFQVVDQVLTYAVRKHYIGATHEPPPF